MKRAGHLLERVASRENLALAFWKASRGRGTSPVVRNFGSRLDGNLTDITREILGGTIAIGGFSRFVVHDPKRREIHAVDFKQRVLHHAILHVCGPVFERLAIDDSFACRPGKGNSAALVRAGDFARRYGFFLKMDIRKYFDSVDHACLQTGYRQLFKDSGLLQLWDRIVASYHTEPGKGLPIGTLTSQFLANFHLNGLDRFVKETLRCPGYVRFMDDFALWGHSEAQLVEWRGRVSDWLALHLGLKVKAGTRLLPCDAGMPFLGFRVLPHAVLLERKARRRLRTKLDRYERMRRWGILSAAQLQRRVGALLAHSDQARCRPWRIRLMSSRRGLTEALS